MFAASVWFSIAGVIVVRQGLDFSTGRAIATCIVNWTIYMAIIFLITILSLGAGAIFEQYHEQTFWLVFYLLRFSESKGSALTFV